MTISKTKTRKSNFKSLHKSKFKSRKMEINKTTNDYELFSNKSNKDFLKIFSESDNSDTFIQQFKKNISIFDNKLKFKEYLENYKPFGDVKFGKSGGIIGYFKNNSNYVMKLYTLKDKINFNNIIRKDECIQIDYRVNEVIINLILSNLNLFPQFSQKDLDLIAPYILPQIDAGIFDKYIYHITPRIGFSYIYNNNKYNITNLYDVIMYNHSKCLSRWINNKNMEIIELYDEFMSYLCGNYLDALKIIQDKISLLTTDMKLNNIFIKEKVHDNKMWEPLRQEGCLIDFIILITDLDKSRYRINNFNIIPINSKKFKNMVAKNLFTPLTISMRFGCNSYSFDKICKKISFNDFELLFMITHLYVMYNNISYNQSKNKKLYFPIEIFTKMENTFLNYLTISKSDLHQLLKIIKYKNYNFDSNFTYYLNQIIVDLCKYIKRKKLSI